MLVFRIILAFLGLIMLGGCGVLIFERIKTWKENSIFYNIVHVVLGVAIFTMSAVCFEVAFF